MSMFENFPYTDMHNLNLDWIIKIAKDFLDQYTHIQHLISDGEISLESLTENGLQQLQDKADSLENALQEWYNEHSEDISEELSDAISDLNEWYSTHEGYLNQYLSDSISSFNTAAEAKAAETIATIPADYTALTNLVNKILGIVQRDTDQYFYQEIYPNNYFDKNNPYIRANKTITVNGIETLNGYHISHTIYLKSGVTYKISKPAGYGNATYAAITDYYGEVSSIFEITFVDGFAEYTPVRDEYIILNCGNNYTWFLVCKASDTITLDTYKFVRKIRDLMIDYDNCAFIEYSINMFNKYDPRIQSDKYINYQTIAPLSGYYISAPIQVEQGTTYVITKPSGFGNTVYMALCDAEGNISSIETLTFSDGIAQYTALASTFILFNVGQNLDNFMVCTYADYPGYYVPYQRKPIRLWMSDEMVSQTNDLITKYKLSGKKLAVTGDSICQGINAGGGYAALIAEKCNMTLQNIAVGGGTIKAETYSGDYPRFWICRSVPNLDSDADYILLEGGVNDGLSDIGTLSSGYDAILDDTTLYGAFESMFKQAINRFPGKKIGFVITHKCTTTFSSNGDASNPYYVAIECCKKWGVPYIDLNTLVPPFGFMPDLKTAYTINGDGWHPNIDGYNAFYVDQIIEFMKTL